MEDILSKACEIILNGGVVGMPTETVYGLAASIESEEGIKKIFSTKERPFFDPLIVHVNSKEMAKSLVKDWPENAELLAKEFWPGPLTIILPKNEKISDLITSGLDSVGLRCPNHPLALKLITAVGHGLAAPSANKFTKTSPTCASHVYDEFGDQVLVLDGGNCEIGIESTIVGIEDNVIKIFRPGKITREDIKNAFLKYGKTVSIEYAKSPVAPGQLEHHYMPKAPIIIVDKNKEINLDKVARELLLNTTTWTLSDDPVLTARELYSQFRELSQDNPSAIIIKVDSKTLQDESWHGIWNRLSKACTYNLL